MSFRIDYWALIGSSVTLLHKLHFEVGSMLTRLSCTGAGHGIRRAGGCHQRCTKTAGAPGVKGERYVKRCAYHLGNISVTHRPALSVLPLHIMKLSILAYLLGVAAAAAADTPTALDHSIDLNLTTAEAGNPIFDGWFADPEIRVYDDIFWIFATTSVAFKNQKHFDAWSSTDLTHWHAHSFLPLIHTVCHEPAVKEK